VDVFPWLIVLCLYCVRAIVVLNYQCFRNNIFYLLNSLEYMQPTFFFFIRPPVFGESTPSGQDWCNNRSVPRARSAPLENHFATSSPIININIRKLAGDCNLNLSDHTEEISIKRPHETTMHLLFREIFLNLQAP
jgi:hypothetical protein